METTKNEMKRRTLTRRKIRKQRERSVEGQGHPLLVDLVLENVFSIISGSGENEKEIALETLLKCRQVCHSWEKLSRIKIQSLATIILTTPSLNQENIFGYSRRDEQARGLTSYMEYLDSKPMLRFNSFKFLELSINDFLTAQFIRKEGSNIKKVSLLYFGEYVNMDFDSIMFRQLLLTIGGSLEHLDIQRLPLSVVKQGFRISENWETLSMNNIKKMTINWQHNASNSFYEDIFFSVHELRSLALHEGLMVGARSRRPDNFRKLISLLPEIPAAAGNHLKHLEINSGTRLTMQDILPLGQLSLITLSLMNVSLAISNGEDGTEFTRCLEQLGRTLKYLHLKNLERPEIDIIPVAFPVLPNLVELTLHIDQDHPIHIVAINYCEIFPKLTHADILTYNANLDYILSAKCNMPHTTLNSLNLDMWMNSNSAIYTHSTIIRAGHIFPKITKLEIGDGCFLAYRAIWSSWPQLEFLTIGFGSYISVLKPDSADFLSPDCLFTGLTESVCMKIRTLKDPRDFRCDEGNPSIVNLKKLRYLKINNKWENTVLDDDEQMSNASIWAITQLPSLEFIKLPKTNHINDDGMKALSEMFPSLRIEKEE